MKRGMVKSLTKALDIIELFVNTKREMALSEISNSLKLNKATVKRIISTLTERGYVYQREKRGKYFLGTKYLNLSDVVKSKMQLRNVAFPYLVKLSNELNEDVILYTLNGKDHVLTETFSPTFRKSQPLRVIPDDLPGNSLYNKASGKIILASYTNEQLKTYFKTEDITQRTSKTITSYEKMKDHLVAVKRDGVAFDDEENSPGVRGVAAELKDGEGKLAGSICVFAPSIRLSRPKMRKLAVTVKSYALQISRNLGYQ